MTNKFIFVQIAYAPQLHSTGSYIYEITVSTGFSFSSGTTANVFITIVGDKGESGLVPLINSPDNSFTSGSVRNFVASFPLPLGQLQYIKIWHDNSGTKPSWFLNQVTVRHVLDNQKWFFLSRQWFAVDKGGGLVERVIYPATEKQINGFKNLFYMETATKLGNDHLWFSVVTKSPENNFTRVQRLTCCFTMIYSALVTNAMFYQFETNPFYVNLGPFKINMTEIMVGIKSGIVAVPANLFIIFMFKRLQREYKCTPKNGNITHTRSDFLKHDKTKLESENKSRWRSMICFRNRRKDYKDISSGEMKRNSFISQKSTGFLFPNWFKFVLYTICFLICATSITFLLFYSINWGKEKSNQWLVSITVSLLQDIVIFQPLKVIVLALLFSSVIRKLQEDTNKINYFDPLDQENMENTRQLTHGTNTNTDLFSVKDRDKINEARIFGLKKNEMFDVFKETALLFLFVICLTVVCYGNRTSDRYRLTKSVKSVFKDTNKVFNYGN